MNASLLGKIAGWLQFVGQAVAQVGSAGLPTNAFGWLSMLGSLAAAIGIHAASSTDGTPAK